MKANTNRTTEMTVMCNVRSHLFDDELTKLLATLKHNRHGHRDFMIALMMYRHGLRVSEACDLQWSDIDWPKRTILIRRLKGSHDGTHYLEKDELTGLKRLKAEQEPKSPWVFSSERDGPMSRFTINAMLKKAGKDAKLPVGVHSHMMRHSAGYALASKGRDTRRIQHHLGHASITNTVRYTALSPEASRDIWR